MTPDAFSFDVKLHRLLSRHSGSLPKLRDRASTGARGHVRLTRILEAALTDALLEAVLRELLGQTAGS